MYTTYSLGFVRYFELRLAALCLLDTICGAKLSIVHTKLPHLNLCPDIHVNKRHYKMKLDSKIENVNYF